MLLLSHDYMPEKLDAYNTDTTTTKTHYILSSYHHYMQLQIHHTPQKICNATISIPTLTR